LAGHDPADLAGFGRGNRRDGGVEGRYQLRLVTHLGVSRNDIARAVEILRDILRWDA
jgi:hypothetical protein